MAWLALDRALRIAAHHRTSARRTRRWVVERAAVREDIEQRGFDTVAGTYTHSYGAHGTDAALLILPQLEFHPPDSPRVRGTIEAITRELDAGGPLLFRYRPGHDGLPGTEGAFLPCSVWLVLALARSERAAEADVLFRDLLALASPLGLYAEEMDHITPAHLGNYPQALTHAALVQAALALRAVDDEPPVTPADAVPRAEGTR
jgi:GH15 family glucan-1,4-alpha-glucosidase